MPAGARNDFVVRPTEEAALAAAAVFVALARRIRVIDAQLACHIVLDNPQILIWHLYAKTKQVEWGTAMCSETDRCGADKTGLESVVLSAPTGGVLLRHATVRES